MPLRLCGGALLTPRRFIDVLALGIVLTLAMALLASLIPKRFERWTYSKFELHFDDGLSPRVIHVQNAVGTTFGRARYILRDYEYGDGETLIELAEQRDAFARVGESDLAIEPAGEREQRNARVAAIESAIGALSTPIRSPHDAEVVTHGFFRHASPEGSAPRYGSSMDDAIIAVGWPRPAFWSDMRTEWYGVSPNVDTCFLDVLGTRIPLTPHWPGLITNVIILASVTFALRAFTAFTRTLFRARRGRCPSCGYDLRHDFTRGCAECGWAKPVVNV